MHFKIVRVILWPKDNTLEPRTIELQVDGLNVLTGQSQTGKSSIIAIIDYCLGGKKCAIPVGLIRDSTDWFGVQVATDKSSILIGRKAPELSDSNSSLYYFEAESVTIPANIQQNSTLDFLKHRLNQLANLTDLNFEDEDSSRGAFRGNAPSFRDLSAFEFQPQHIIANPYTLFFKADTYEHQEKLKAIFPLVLGVIDNSTIRAKKEIKELERELARYRAELETKKKIFTRWESEIAALYSQAVELGLVQSENVIQHGWSTAQYIAEIIQIIQRSKSGLKLEIRVGSTERIVSEINKLSQEESDISHQIGRIKRQLQTLTHLSATEAAYEGTLSSQQIRLAPAGWFADKVGQSSICPMCGQISSSAQEHVAMLVKVAKELKNATESVAEAKVVVDKEILRLSAEISDLEQRLNVVRGHKRSLELSDEQARLNRQRQEDVYRFIGRMEQSVSNYKDINEDSQLSQTIARLEDRLRGLRRKVADQDETRKLEAAITKISENAGAYAKLIGVELPENTVRLDITNLTVNIQNASGRSDYLWEIGSGANWMGYHLAILLGLHEYFIGMANSSVPTFFVVDQPSQVYFPESWPEDEPDAEGAKESISSDDILRVKKIFKTFSEFVKRTKGKVQVLVIDHADEITWSGVEGIHLVDRWRGNTDFLIPRSWIPAEERSAEV